MYRIFILPVLVICFMQTRAQELSLDQASDPVSMVTRITIDLESYSFENGSMFYGIKPGYYYGLRNEKHLVGMSIPFMHNVFEGNYAGFENTTGFGDLKMSYLFVPYQKQNIIGIERATFSFDVTAPTGEYLLGRGAGAWLYKPGIIIKWRIAESLSFILKCVFNSLEAKPTVGQEVMERQTPRIRKRMTKYKIFQCLFRPWSISIVGMDGFR